MQDIWDAVEKRNAWNCLNREHGVPFWRLAKFGFHAQVNPKDLSGILNANALYTFSCGIAQMVFGIILVKDLLGTPDAFQAMVPLPVSFISFVLSVLNVLKDFSGMLVLAENEENLTHAILAANESRNRTERAVLTQKRQDRVEAIQKQDNDAQAKAGAQLDATRAIRLRFRLQEVDDDYKASLDQLEENALVLVELDLRCYRKRRDRILAALRGKNEEADDDDNEIAKLAFAAEEKKMDLTKAVESVKNKKIAALIDEMEANPDKVSPGDFDRRLKEITADNTATRRSMQEMGERTALGAEIPKTDDSKGLQSKKATASGNSPPSDSVRNSPPSDSVKKLSDPNGPPAGLGNPHGRPDTD